MTIDWKKEIKLSDLGGIARSAFRRRGASDPRESPGQHSPDSSRRRTALEAPSFLTDVKAPRMVIDLYADLRDRRLLPLVAVLLIAMVAAPILLSHKSDPEPAVQPTLGGDPGQQAQNAFAVVPAGTGLRDYRSRLGHRQQRDPFALPGVAPSSGASAKGPADAGAKVDGGAGQAPSGESPSASVSSPEHVPSTAKDVAEPGSETPPVEPPAGGAGNDGSSATEATPQPGQSGESDGGPGDSGSHGSAPTTTVVERTVTGYEIAATTLFVGKDGESEEIKAQEMAKLPDPKLPLAIYLGVSDDKKGALFLLGNSVTAYYGQGHCTLDKQSCTILELRPGKSATLAYGIEEERYKITLDAIEPEVTTKQIEKASAGSK